MLNKKVSYNEWMRSDDEVLFAFRSISIANDRDKPDTCWSSNDVWSRPIPLGYPTQDD